MKNQQQSYIAMSPKDKQSNEQQQQVQQVQQQQQQLNEEMAITNLIESIFQEDKEYNAKQNSNSNTAIATNTTNSYFTMGLAAAFVIAHGAILFSLPPVILGKGAPFLPTKGKTMDAMFRLIRKQPQIQHKLQKLQKQQQLLASSSASSSSSLSSLKGMTFVDLGSGDGRMVFRSARESNLFHQSFGYEINPVLHIFAKTRRIIQYSNYYKSTNFYRQDLWKLNLKNIDVIAVYGLYPIMDRLGQKMQEEVTDGTIVVSNVFSIPGWKPIVVENGIFIYSIPESLS